MTNAAVVIPPGLPELESETIPHQHPDQLPVAALGAPSDRPPILATDLDGTMASGPGEVRTHLARALSGERAPELIYASNLPFPRAESLRRFANLPNPDVWITDAGCWVASRRYHDILMPLEMELDAVWPGADAVRERLRQLDIRMTVKSAGGRRRMEVDVERGSRSEDVRGALEDALGDLSVAVRHGEDGTIAIMPEGIDRGTTLLRVLFWLGGDRKVVLGGRLLGEVALLRSGLPGFTLPDAHPLVRRVVRERTDLYLARHSGVAGMADGLRHFGLISDEHGVSQPRR